MSSQAEADVGTIELMRALLLSILFSSIALPVLSQETPLTALPYTPSLDTTFMDRSADPCKDFYKYACGNWNKLNPIPPDQDSWDVYGKLTNENLRYLWGILEQAGDASRTRTANEQKIGDYFHSCMNEGAVERAGYKPLDPMLAQIASLKSVNDIAGYIADRHRQGMGRGVLFGFSAAASSLSLKNTSWACLSSQVSRE